MRPASRAARTADLTAACMLKDFVKGELLCRTPLRAAADVVGAQEGEQHIPHRLGSTDISRTVGM